MGTLTTMSAGLSTPFGNLAPLTQTINTGALVLTATAKVGIVSSFCAVVTYLPQHNLNFFPLPQGQGSLRPVFFDGASDEGWSAGKSFLPRLRRR